RRKKVTVRESREGNRRGVRVRKKKKQKKQTSTVVTLVVVRSLPEGAQRRDQSVFVSLLDLREFVGSRPLYCVSLMLCAQVKNLGSLSRRGWPRKSREMSAFLADQWSGNLQWSTTKKRIPVEINLNEIRCEMKTLGNLNFPQITLSNFERPV